MAKVSSFLFGNFFAVLEEPAFKRLEYLSHDLVCPGFCNAFVCILVKEVFFKGKAEISVLFDNGRA